MAQYVWPYYYPQQQQQQHPYFQFPPTSGGSGYTHRPSKSWQGSPNMSPPVLPTFLPVVAAPPPVAAAPVYQPTLLHPDYSRSRRHSFDGAFVPMQPVPVATAPTVWPTAPAPYFTYSSGWAPVELPRPQLHNLINGDIIAPRLYINFVDADLVFRKRSGSGIHHLSTLSSYDLEQPATHPQMTRVRIECDMIRQWPIDLQVIGTSLSPHRRRRAALPYLTLEDIVHSVHAALHRKISHQDWGRLSTSQETDVAKAYTRRYKSAGSEWNERQQQSEGVKRVDFLLKTTWFKGFTWLEPENGVERLRLLVGMDP
ncbi:hypothetical protein BGY98DRAFT_970596 [Russula aff. rugulosa BPL654]|jgi:hypothetical protein|nr:hypothetical protein BGY98DRAFT_970596 [Russula aff. rugulosa BPL654]